MGGVIYTKGLWEARDLSKLNIFYDDIVLVFKLIPHTLVTASTKCWETINIT